MTYTRQYKAAHDVMQIYTRYIHTRYRTPINIYMLRVVYTTGTYGALETCSSRNLGHVLCNIYQVYVYISQPGTSTYNTGGVKILKYSLLVNLFRKQVNFY